MVFQKLHTAHRAVVGQQKQGGDKCESKPGGRKFLDRIRLILLEERQNDDRAHGRQPGDDG